MTPIGSESTGYRGGRRGSGCRGGGRRGGPSTGKGGQNQGQGHGRGQEFPGMVCYNCGGIGHKASLCPSAIQGQGRGRGRNDRGRSQGRGRGRQTWNAGMAAGDRSGEAVPQAAASAQQQGNA